MKKNPQVAVCTYFDKNYLLKGVSMCQSFSVHNPGIKIFVLSLDEYTKKIVDKLKIKNLTTISLNEFEDPGLIKAKKNRSLVEYYWTCSPSLPRYVLKKYPQFKKVVYLDADMFFYAAINEVLDELGDGSVLTVEHRYPRGQSYRNLTTGRFNVAFQIFTNKKESLDCLERWRNQCLKWCYNRIEGSKMGDQMYLNEWPFLYKDLVVSHEIGIDVAPWNISQYKLTKKNNQVMLNNRKLICYHFHQFNLTSENSYELSSGYSIPTKAVELIYKPYIKSLKEQIVAIKHYDPDFFIKTKPQSVLLTLKSELIKSISPLYWLAQTSYFGLIHKKKTEKDNGIKVGYDFSSYIPGKDKSKDAFVRNISVSLKSKVSNEYLFFCNKNSVELIKEYNNSRVIVLPIEKPNFVTKLLYRYILVPIFSRMYSVDVSKLV